jgi:5-methylcytosine-specific restriction endonuclease McrA
MPIGVPKSGNRKSSPRVERVGLKCEHCGFIRSMVPSLRRLISRFCSRACYVASKRRRVVYRQLPLLFPNLVSVSCGGCGTKLWRSPARIAKAAGKAFCSSVCAASVRPRFDLKQWRESNRQRLNQRSAEWRRANRDKVAANENLRRSVKPDRATFVDFQARKKQSLGFCIYCGKVTDKLQMDHIVPVVSGGGSSLENLIPACSKCNQSKGSKDVADWLYASHGSDGLARAILFLEAGEVRSCFYG